MPIVVLVNLLVFAALVAVVLFATGAGPKDSGVALSIPAEATATPEKLPRCRSARSAVPYYRARTWERQAERGGQLADRTPLARGRSCHWARYVADEWQARARSALRALERHLRRLENPTYAICHVFGRYCSEALRVASCESGRGVYAQNGQYLGMFQMGDYARSEYGHSTTAIGQARSAYAYFAASGYDWSPWSCKP
jgi:hypothetical protein